MVAPGAFETRLSAAHAGDEAEIGALLQRCAPALRRAVSADLPRRWQRLLTVDDVFQETCVDAFRDLRSFAGRTERALCAWLTRIAKRNLLDAVRMLEAERRGGGTQPLARVNHAQASVELLLTLAGRTTPSLVVSRQEAVEALQEALEGLPDIYRRVLEEFDLAGRDMSEVAKALGRSRGSVYMLRARAFRLLRERLGDTTHFFSGSA